MSRNPNADLSASEVLLRLHEEPQHVRTGTIEVVGAWVWVTFPDYPGKEACDWLRALGFRWNRRRGCWQHCGGVRRPAMRSGDPRDYYGADRVSVDDEEAA
jgi:hypothetical protein